MLILNEANQRIQSFDNYSNLTDDISLSLKNSSIFTIALPSGVTEVSRMELSENILLENVRLGFAAAYEQLQIDKSLQVSLI